ncbi:DUF4252 domain-containing protein [Maribacter cobaltidurans]|uniref:Uncharacterized protein n=1 Tax=Maribacter cobaltidurans TaxID=1178778 RepID=A0A223V9C4_9FLAO|nr:DUF4252 domain-containing protein [Maribacter cobaltidurans]ASV31912.1 hypothetical protein CJ263_17750 [Maribacter cobaltidurans]GGD85606.1 hypothetical protein GCM10011412_24260 [Maribacter cobaltidurans]
MKLNSLAILLVLVLSACSSKQSLQEYYIDNTENPNFLHLDVPTSILNLEEVDLTEVQRTALSSLRKLNILAFKKTEENTPEYKVQKQQVKTILSNDNYSELIKMNTEFGRATVKYLGDDDAIDEVIIYGDNDDKGFAIIRVLGDDMNPAHFVQLLQAIQKSNFKGEGLGELGDFLKG